VVDWFAFALALASVVVLVTVVVVVMLASIVSPVKWTDGSVGEPNENWHDLSCM